MATSTATRARKTASKKDDAEKATPEETPTANSTEESDNTGNENGTENAETEMSLLDQEINGLPAVDDAVVATILEMKIAPDLVSIQEYDATILANTLNEEGVRNYADTATDNEELVALRKDRDNRLATIRRLEEQIEELEEANEGTEKKMYDLAETEMRKSVDENVRLTAKATRETVVKRVNAQFSAIKTAFLPNWKENQELSEWLTETSTRINGVKSAGTANGNNRSRHDRQKQAEMREWAINNGIKVNERGRLPRTVVIQYNDAHGIPNKTD